MPGQSVHSLRKSLPELYLSSARGKPKDLYSTNPRDAGMRVVLPGEPGSPTLYHVRVRSSNLREGDAASRLVDPNFLNAGLTKGAYQLQIRLREIDEVPGSSVNYADLRFATNGVEVVGTRHSPLLGETAEVGTTNDTIGNSQPVGNLLVSDKQAISIAGSLSRFDDVDWYTFTIDYTAIRPSELRRYFSTVFDMDYADGVGRPDTSIYVFDSANRLILGGLSSNLVDDQATGLSGSGGVADTSRGSAGGLDPYIGAAELPVGRYFLAVTSSEMMPRALTAYLNSGNTQLKMQPTNGVQLIAEDHLDGRAVNPTAISAGATAVNPVTPVLFPNQTTVNGTTIVGSPGLELDLSDVPLFVSTRPETTNGANGHILNTDNRTDIYMVNALTGETNFAGGFNQTVLDLAFKRNGELQTFDISPQAANAAADQDNLMDYLELRADANGNLITATEGNLGIQTFHTNFTATPTTPFTQENSNDGIYPNAMTFATIGSNEIGLIVGSRGERFGRDINGNNTPSSTRPDVAYFDNIVYRFDPNSGAGNGGTKVYPIGRVNGAGTVIQEYGYIETSNPATLRRGVIGRDATVVLPTEQHDV